MRKIAVLTLVSGLFLMFGCTSPRPTITQETNGQLLTVIGPYTNGQGIKVIRFIWVEDVIMYAPHTAPENDPFIGVKAFKEVEVYPVEKVPAEILGKPLWMNVTIQYKVVNEKIPIIYLLNFKQVK
jgi:hypothetical protein